jgi:hypothetical protein
VVRAAVLVCLQQLFGEQSSLAIELAKALDHGQLDAVLSSEHPKLEVFMAQRTFRIDLDAEYLLRVREGLSKVRA